MKAIILAAGRGSRMHEGTANIPKCMMNVCGEPLITRCVRTLELAGFSKNDIAIVTGYRHEVIEQAIPGVKYYHNAEWEQTNMVYSLTKAQELLKTEDCIVVYSDIIFSPNSISSVKNTLEDIAIPYNTNYLELWKDRFENPLDDLETFSLDSKGYLKEIGAHPTCLEQVEGQYMGIVKFTPAGWDIFINSLNYANKPFEKIDMTSLLNASIKNGAKICCISSNELWLECDNLHDISVYENKYKKF